MAQPTRQNVSQSELTKKGEELAEKLDDLLDEIDEILEENSCVRAVSGPTKSSHTRLSRCGRSKMSRIVCAPGCAARHPGSSPGTSAASMGCALSSEVTSTWASCSTSSQS